MLLIAGHITTTATLGNSVVTFADNPAAAAEIRADPTLLGAAIEEVLRVRTPFPRLARFTTVDTQVGGVDILAGQVVLPWLTAANRDERVFADPHRFDIHRSPNPHLSFGHGIHFCLGAPLARLEARVALLLLGRYRDIEVALDARRAADPTGARRQGRRRCGGAGRANRAALRDIEWARANGELFVVQARPIPALPEPEAEPPTDWSVPVAKTAYFRASIVEQLPDPLSPLFADLIDPSVARSLGALLREFLGQGVLRDG